jgi:hypothetical protein
MYAMWLHIQGVTGVRADAVLGEARCAHFEAIRLYTVEDAQQSVHSREDDD